MIRGGTSTITARVSATFRDSFDRRNEIIQKVGGWVANTHESSPRSSTDWEEIDVPKGGDGTESRAAEEIKRLESEVRKNKEEITPEEYIARIKKRREDRVSKDIKGIEGGGGKTSLGEGDPLGVVEGV